jgi:hypothetical protein
MLGQMLHGHQPVIRLLGQFQHADESNPTNLIGLKSDYLGRLLL